MFCAISTGTAAATSPDGITWTPRTLPVTAGAWTSIAFGNSLFCIVAGSAADAATSPDGITWTLRVLPSSAIWIPIVWNGSVFCCAAIGSTKAATSPDGITWTARTLPVSTDWYSLCWNGRTFCALGASSIYVTLSADGTTWSGVSNSLPAPLATGTDYWVIAIAGSTTTFQLSATRGGAAINITTTTTGAVLVGYHWTADLATGKIYLDSKPSGVLTLDGIAGTTAASSIVPTVLGATQIDTRSQTRFATTCAQPQGYYAADRVNRLDVVQAIISGLGAWYGYNRFGLLQFGRIESSYTAGFDYELLEHQFDDNSLTCEAFIKPEKRHRMGYRKNWTNQDGKLVAGVSAEARNLYSQDFSATAPQAGTDESPDGSSEFHLLAVKPDVIPSMMAYGSDGLVEAIRRDALRFGWGRVIVGRVGKIGSELSPGMVVKVTHTRFELSGGVRMPLVGVQDLPTERATVLRFLQLPLTNYTPSQL